MATRHSSGATAAPSPVLDIHLEIAKLAQLSIRQLRERFTEVSGDATESRNRIWLIRRIAWHLQANAYGGLSERARALAKELADDAYLRVVPPRNQAPPQNATERVTVATLAKGADTRLPTVGTILCREYKGRTLCVEVVPTGFVYDGKLYKSLSAVAKHITNSHVNGFRFFGLAKGGAT